MIELDRNDKDQHIRQQWFKDHKATLSQHGDLQVLDWKRPGTITYYCRYVFDGNKMYISGDIGEAVFWLTWKADVHSFDDIHVGYFEEKLAAYSRERRDFNSDKAVRRLREWINDLKENEKAYDHDDMRELFERARDCSSKDEWAHIVNDNGWISGIDCDYWEWMYSIGDEIPWRIHGYLVGLKMASEQLKSKTVVA